MAINRVCLKRKRTALPESIRFREPFLLRRGKV